MQPEANMSETTQTEDVRMTNWGNRVDNRRPRGLSICFMELVVAMFVES
jgi:hypothetical protein